MGCILGSPDGAADKGASNSKGKDRPAGGAEEKKKKKKGNPDYPFVPAENIVKDLWSNFSKIKVLGKGASCEVAQVVRKSDKSQWAMKIMAQDDRWNPILFKQEVQILTALSHNNIMQYENC